jgi:carbon storage regulator
MLVLTRSKDESIVIGGNVVVTVVEVRGDKVRLGFEAPREISVNRLEIHEALEREKRGKKKAN